MDVIERLRLGVYDTGRCWHVQGHDEQPPCPHCHGTGTIPPDERSLTAEVMKTMNDDETARIAKALGATHAEGTQRLDGALGLTVEEAVATLGTDTVTRAIGHLPCVRAESIMRQHADEPTHSEDERRAWRRLAVQGADSVRLVIANAT